MYMYMYIYMHNGLVHGMFHQIVFAIVGFEIVGLLVRIYRESKQMSSSRIGCVFIDCDDLDALDI